jgi:hypothetical protein
MDLKEISRDSVDWIHLAQDRNHENDNESSGSVKGEEFLD